MNFCLIEIKFQMPYKLRGNKRFKFVPQKYKIKVTSQKVGKGNNDSTKKLKF